MELTTSLRLCREHNACDQQYALLVQALGPDWGDDQPIPLTYLLDLRAEDWTATSNTLWAFRAVPAEQRDSRDRVAASFCVEVLGAIPGPPEHDHAVQVLRAFAVAQATIEGVQKAARAAWDAWDARDAWATRAVWGAWAAWDAWAAWGAWTAWTAWTTRAARATWTARAARAARAARDAWAAWAAWTARDAMATWTARDAMAAWGAWAAWTAWTTRAARATWTARDARVLRFLLEMEASND